MKNNVIKNIVIDALFLALIICFTFIPFLGYISIIPNLVSITTMHLIVLIGAALFGWKKGLLYGFFFGASSLIKALISTSPVDQLFINPFISILPRILFGYISGLTFSSFKKIMTYKKFLCFLPLFSFLLTGIHTILTLGSLYIFGILDIFKISSLLGLSELINTILNTGFIIYLGVPTFLGALGEMIASFIIITPLFIALRKINFIKEIDNTYLDYDD